jgi:Fe-S cluster assembly ATP-binding protein
MELLKIKDLHAKAGEKDILKGLDLTINKGEVHVIMGPNGAGKSTLANVIMHNPEYNIESGEIIFDGENVTDKKADEIARLGVFMSFQNPEEVPGINLTNFLKTAKNSITGEPVRLFEFKKEISGYMEKLDINSTYANRDLNVGYSGGEKKKNEILQMLTLNPKLAILDETDSGLDVDAIKTVSQGINMFKNEENSILLITHSMKLISDLKVDYVHVLVDGKVVFTGDGKLAKKIEKDGYSEFIGA